MKLIAIHRTFDYRGDHEAEIERVFEIHDGESVEELWIRVGAGELSLSKRDRSKVEIVQAELP